MKKTETILEINELFHAGNIPANKQFVMKQFANAANEMRVKTISLKTLNYIFPKVIRNIIEYCILYKIKLINVSEKDLNAFKQNAYSLMTKLKIENSETGYTITPK